MGKERPFLIEADVVEELRRKADELGLDLIDYISAALASYEPIAWAMHKGDGVSFVDEHGNRMELRRKDTELSRN